MSKFSRTVALGAIAAAACGHPTTETDASALQTESLPCDVAKIVQDRCVVCHANPPKAGAPMPLVTYADWKGTILGRPVVAWAGERLNDSARPMPPAGDLPDGDRATLLAWLAAGAPPGSCAAPAAAPPVVDGGAPVCTVDTPLHAATPYAMGMQDDQYICFGIDVSVAKKRHVIGIVPQVDNATILHHALLFQAEGPEDPTPHPCDSFGSIKWRLIGGWAPGGEAAYPPPEAGFPEDPGTTHWVVQLHYNNVARHSDQRDQSGFGLCTTEQLRPYDAGMMAFGATRFTIPPRTKHAVTCDVALDDKYRGVHFFGGSAHMHQLGAGFSLTRTPVGTSAPQPVLETSDFNFKEQRRTTFAVDVAPGDHISTRCDWSNPTDQTVSFGERTEDEMCFGFISYYPAIVDPAFSWASPANAASCSEQSL